MSWGQYYGIKISTSEKSVLKQASGRTCGPMEREAYTGTGFLAGLVTSWGTHTGAPVPQGLHPVEGTHAGAVPEVQPVGRSHTGEINGGLLSVGGTHA